MFNELEFSEVLKMSSIKSQRSSVQSMYFADEYRQNKTQQKWKNSSFLKAKMSVKNTSNLKPQAT